MKNKLKRLLERIRFANDEFAKRVAFEKAMFTIKVENNSFFHGNNKVENYSIGKNSYVSYNSIVYNCEIGNYCSIGPNVVIGYGDHPLNLLTTYPYIYFNSDFFDVEEINNLTEKNFSKVVIKNDVWIGANVYIKNGIVIGNGAVIGAGSVVTKNVADFEVVVGVPARLLRKRFDDDIIELILKTEWWNLDIEQLKKYSFSFRDPSRENLLKMLSDVKKC